MKTPYYLISESELVKSLEGFKLALSNHFQRYIPSYSVKTNSLPYILRKANSCGYYAEVVSDDEYNLALKCGFEKSLIVFNGPMKSREVFLDAIEGGALVNIETFRELEWLKELDQSRRFTVGLRMNINISSISPEDENHIDDNSRFGFSVESGDFQKAIEIIRTYPNVDFNRIHIHRTSRTRSVRFYCNLVKYAIQQLENHHLSVDCIDLGGGFYGMMPGKPSYEDYAAAISRTIDSCIDSSSLTVIIEPGNAIVASCLSLFTSVIDVKNHDGAYFVTIDGSRIDIDPFFRKSSYFKKILYNEHGDGNIVSTQVIGGCTCLEYDRLMELNDQRLLQVGDRIRFDRVGAYTMTLTPMFIRYWPAVYLDNGREVTMIRNKFNEEKLF